MNREGGGQIRRWTEGGGQRQVDRQGGWTKREVDREGGWTEREVDRGR